jgi:adenylate cyclase
MDNHENLGELVPVGGGDTIPLVREVLVLGRRESCDVCLRFPNVSGRHCELNFKDGFWILRDLDSTNGIKVNGNKVHKKLLHPGDTITIARRSFTIQYSTPINRSAAELEEQMAEEAEESMSQPLLEKAGLQKPQRYEIDEIDEKEAEELRRYGLVPPGSRESHPPERPD